MMTETSPMSMMQTRNQPEISIPDVTESSANIHDAQTLQPTQGSINPSNRQKHNLSEPGPSTSSQVTETLESQVTETPGAVVSDEAKLKYMFALGLKPRDTEVMENLQELLKDIEVMDMVLLDPKPRDTEAMEFDKLIEFVGKNKDSKDSLRDFFQIPPESNAESSVSEAGTQSSSAVQPDSTPSAGTDLHLPQELKGKRKSKIKKYEKTLEDQGERPRKKRDMDGEQS